MTNQKKVLFVDDDVEFQSLMASHLANALNTKITCVSHPYEAIERMTERRFDLILLDWRMPSLRGDAALKNFERLWMESSFIPSKWFKEKIPVIVLSAESPSRVKKIETEFFHQIGYVSKRQNATQILSEVQALFAEELQKSERPRHLSVVRDTEMPEQTATSY
ncbi:MAG: response regulator [Bdellovibrionaceae bacterium]|nr:response regulator [Pseudobdellovibrionaceae bacterium]